MVDDKRTALERLEDNVHGRIYDIKSFIFGEILNVTDVVARDDEQKKAFKELVRKAVWANEYISNSISIQFRKFAEAKKMPFNADRNKNMGIECCEDIASGEKNPYEVE